MAAHTAITAGCIIAGNASRFIKGMNIFFIIEYAIICQVPVFHL
jgi:hypothetical protein